jgi:site-specific DNA recombinase
MLAANQYRIVSETKHEENKDVLAAIYARVSTPNQVMGYSLDEQIRRCRERCDLMGWKVRYILKENGSGATTDRPKFQMMMKEAKERRFDVLVFWKLDRLCRSLFDLINTERELRECGISLYSVTEPIDTTSSVGRFSFRNIVSASELERELIKERSRMGMHAMARQHKWPNNYPPLGYDKTGDGHLKINEEEARLVLRIFESYIELESMPEVVFELNKEEIKTKRGNKWSAPSIKKVLDDELYIGRYKVAGVDDYIEEYRIIEDELFQNAKKLRHRFQKNRKMPEERKETTIDGVFGEYLKFLDEMEEEDLKLREELASCNFRTI